MSEPQTTHEVTLLLKQVRNAATPAANDRLFELVYQQLKIVAVRYMAGEKAGHTLQPTALVSEAYIRLTAALPQIDWQDRAHLMGVAARQMRHILVEHSRKKKADKRGSGGIPVTLSHAEGSATDSSDFEELEDALVELEKKAPSVAQVVELKFYGGLQDREIAEFLNMSFAQVRRDWEFGRAFLKHRLQQ